MAGVTTAPSARTLSSVLLHLRENFGVGSIVTVVLRLFVFTTAVIVTFSMSVARLDTLAENVKPVAVAGIFTDEGTVTFGELLVKVATSPPAGACADR